MNRTWVTRIGLVVVAWAAACGGGLLAGASPRPVVLAALLLAASAIFWLVADVAVLAETASWQSLETVHHVVRGHDLRLAMIARNLADLEDPRGYSRHLQPTLVAIVDERLAARGIDRRSAPERARAVMGDQLADFLGQPTPPPATRDPRYMSELLARIESL